MANIDNLKPIQKGELTKEEAKKRGSNGGKASAKKKRQQKTFKEMFNAFSQQLITNEQLKEKLKENGISDEDMTNKTAMMFSMYLEAVKGNTKAFEIVRDTMGEQIVDKIELTEVPVIKDDI